MNISTLCITNEEGKYYQSNREYVSVDCRWVDNEIDATFMDEADLLYLLNEADLYAGEYGCIHISYKQMYIGSITICDFERPNHQTVPGRS